MHRQLAEQPSTLVSVTNEITHPANALASAASAYLRSAMHQPIQWHEWGAEAFALAAAQDKPILLDIGAVWCHWCHVMDRESYETPKLAEIVNRHFIAVPGSGAGDGRPGWLASDCDSYLGRASIFRRHLLSARRPLRPAGFWAGTGDDGRGVAGAPG